MKRKFILGSLFIIVLIVMSGCSSKRGQDFGEAMRKFRETGYSENTLNMNYLKVYNKLSCSEIEQKINFYEKNIQELSPRVKKADEEMSKAQKAGTLFTLSNLFFMDVGYAVSMSPGYSYGEALQDKIDTSVAIEQFECKRLLLNSVALDKKCKCANTKIPTAKKINENIIKVSNAEKAKGKSIYKFICPSGSATSHPSIHAVQKIMIKDENYESAFMKLDKKDDSFRKKSRVFIYTGNTYPPRYSIWLNWNKSNEEYMGAIFDNSYIQIDTNKDELDLSILTFMYIGKMNLKLEKGKTYYLKPDYNIGWENSVKLVSMEEKDFIKMKNDLTKLTLDYEALKHHPIKEDMDYRKKYKTPPSTLQKLLSKPSKP